MKKNKEISGKIPHVHRLEELTLLRYLYYPKRTIDSMNSLSINAQITFFCINRKVYPKIHIESQETTNN